MRKCSLTVYCIFGVLLLQTDLVLDWFLEAYFSFKENLDGKTFCELFASGIFTPTFCHTYMCWSSWQYVLAAFMLLLRVSYGMITALPRIRKKMLALSRWQCRDFLVWGTVLIVQFCGSVSLSGKVTNLEFVEQISLGHLLKHFLCLKMLSVFLTLVLLKFW